MQERTAMALLEIQDLSLSIGGNPILKDVDLTLEAGQTLGIVGESGSGKSLTALSVMQLLPHESEAAGNLRFDGIDMLAAPESSLVSLRGRSIGMVFQEPMTALNPVKTIGAQVSEGMRFHLGLGKADAETKTRRLLEEVGLPPSKYPLDRFPHELSGGQRQRVVIAIAIALRPKLLIADEPTTALDVTTQATILDLLRNLSSEHEMALMLISHDLAVVADMADHIAIMRSGRVVEQGATVSLFDTMQNPYSLALKAASTLDNRQYERKAISDAEPLMRVDGLTRRYAKPRSSIFSPRDYNTAVDGVSFDLGRGESMGLVGESGCGKSTLARAILALDKFDAGQVTFDGRNLATLSGSDLADLRSDMQVVFQDPYGSFNPRHTVARLVTEPMHLMANVSRSEKRDRAAEVLSAVGLGPEILDRYPHEFSGGQRQRIAIARAIITEPKLVVADEPVSALDVSVRGQVLDLMAELGDRLGMAYLFISHDLHVVRAVTDRVLVMKAGKIVEQGATESVFSNPQHDYTRSLLSATLDLRKVLDRRRVTNRTEVP
jgi:peptide/nickel transport system ATP-binding protein